MAENIAEMQLIGNLGRNAETRTLASGKTVTEASIAVNYENGAGEKKVQWYAVQVWGKRGESLAQYLTKGKLMRFVGRPEAQAWVDGEGKLHTKLVLHINGNNNALQFLGGPRVEVADVETEAEIPF